MGGQFSVTSELALFFYIYTPMPFLSRMAMKQSLLTPTKMGIPLRGKMKKSSRSDFKSRANSEDLDASFSASPQISSITDNVSTTSSNSLITAAGNLDEVESNYPSVPLLSENSSDQAGQPEFALALLVKDVGAGTENLNEASTSIAAASCIEEIVEDGGSCAGEILTGFSEVTVQPEVQIIAERYSEKDVGERNLEVTLAGFSRAMEKLCGVIMELIPAIEQRKRRNGNDAVFFFLVMLGEITLAFFVGAMLILILLTVVTPEGYLISNNLSDFNGPTPT